MFYTFPWQLLIGNVLATPKRLDMELSAGIIHQVDILFQKDAAHKNLVKIFKGSHQLWPSNRKEALRGDATVISFREFVELKGADNTLHALIWTTDTDVLKEVVIQIGVLPKSVVMPLSFDELVKAVAGL